MSRKKTADDKTINSSGYVLLWMPDHPDSDIRGYVYEHRFVAEKMLGRRLLKTEHVHHKDGIKSNNDPSNLEVLNQAYHRLEHRKVDANRRLPDQPNQIITCKCGCGVSFELFDKYGRPRYYVSGHNQRRSNGN